MAQSLARPDAGPGRDADAAGAGPTGPGRHHGGALLAELLVEHGVTHVFGVPGGQTLALYDGIVDLAPAIRHVLVRDERTAAYAADGFARASGRVGVCDATVGPGAAKLPSGLGEALGASVPVLALVSDLPRAMAPHRYRSAASQALDQGALLDPVTKWWATVENAEVLPALVRHAFREATTGRPGPVALLLPQDVLDGPAPPWRRGAGERFGRFPAARSGPDPADVDGACRVLDAAERPVIVAGGGVLHADAGEQVRSVAERLSAGVATTLSGKGSLAEDHRLALGVVGAMGTSAARAAIEEADVVFFVGAKGSSGATTGWSLPRPDQQVVQLDVDPVELGRAFDLTAGMAGDACLGLEALLAALCPGHRRDAGKWEHRIAQLNEAWRKERDNERSSKAVPIAPQRLMAELEAALRPEDVVVCDASLASGWGGVYLEQRTPGRRVLTPRGLAGLGYALPAAIGVAMAGPDHRTVVVCGDGALGYALGELATVAEHGLPVTVVVLDNRSLGWIRWYRRITFGRGWEEPDFAEMDFAGVAASVGWQAARVAEPDRLAPALADALAADRPSLLDVVTETWETPLAGHRRAVEDPSATAGYGG